MIEIKSRADRTVMWVLVTLGLAQVFWLSFNVGLWVTRAVLNN